MLRDSDFAQRMQQAHPEAAKTLGQRLRELLGRIMDAIKAAYQGGRLSREASMLMREAERYREIADMWAEGVQKAAEMTGREQEQESITEAAESESEAAESVAEAAEIAGEGMVRNKLDKVVADVREYPSGDEARRLELLNERDDVKFQKREYTFDELTAKPDMLVTYVDTTQNIDRETAVKLGRENVMQYADRFDANGTPAMYVDDLGKYVVVGNNALKHGLDGQRVSAQAPVIARIGDILRNSIVVNEATPKKTGVRNSWIMLGAAQDGNGQKIYVRSVINQSTGHLDEVSAMYAAYAKKEKAGRTFSVPGASANGLGNRTSSTISIAELLSGVKGLFDDVISADVARRLGIERRQSEFTSRLKYQPRDEQISIREVLANVMEDASTSADEMAWLKGYRKDLKELDKKLDAISQNKQIIRELMFKKGRTSEESQRLSKARERLKILQEQVTRMDEGLKRD